MDQPSANIAAFVKFAKAWEALDLDGVVAAFTPDAIYHNQPTDPVRGRDAVRAAIRPWLADTTKMTWEIHNIAETPSGVVLAERTDTFVMNGHAVALPVMGAFEFKDGLITAWRDYYDPATVTRQMAGA